LYILLAILLLGVLIAVHEFGHFIAARITGIPVKEFSIGFGPKILKWKSKKHDTLFSLRPIPMGGFCMFYGDTEDDPDGKLKDDPRSYVNAAVWKRMLSVVSGPLMNMILAFAVAIGFMVAYGQTGIQPFISEVSADRPAHMAGMQPGDIILDVNGINMEGETVSAAVEAIGASKGAPTSITVSRDGEIITVELTPMWSNEQNRYLIGVNLSGKDRRPMAIGEIIPAAWDTCVFASGAILDALGKMVTTGEGFNETAGIVGMVQIVADETRQGGMQVFLNLLIIISINLGLVNLLPIPGLDGSRLVFMLIEAIRRKPVSQRVEATIHMCGLVLLVGLMIFFVFRDVGRIIGG